MSVQKILLPAFFDAHVHFREESLLEPMVRATARYSDYGLAMPNLKKSIATAEEALAYGKTIRKLARKNRCGHFHPVLTIKLLKTTTPRMINEAAYFGIRAAKLMPEGVTTNSDDGVADPYDSRLLRNLRMMEKTGMVLCVHAEMPGFEDDPDDGAEAAYLPVVKEYSRLFPHLKIVIEHLSSAGGVEAFLGLGDNVACTITAHHLAITRAEAESDIHHRCKPMPKSKEDREALWILVKSGHPRVFLGSDSAPHPIEQKKKYKKYGVFTAIRLPEYLATFFEEQGALKLLPDFVAGNAHRFYHLPSGTRTITVVREPRQVPGMYWGVVPLLAGRVLPWSFKG